MTALLATLCVVGLALACGDDDDDGPLTVNVEAEVLEPDAPVAVEAKDVRKTEDGLFVHEVRVEWRGDEAARLDDARFTHHATVDDGDLVTAGRGCGATWDEGSQEVLQACTADLQLIDLQPGETHDYVVRIYSDVGPLRLRRGVYVVEETVGWIPVEGSPSRAQQDGGQFTVRLTYDVR